MQTLTIKRGPDGFGSQILSIISGIAYAKVHNFEYVHSPIENLKLVDKDSFQNSELNLGNDMLESIMVNLEIKQNVKPDIIKPFFHKEIKENGVNNYYNSELMHKLSNAYPIKLMKPSYYDDTNINIAIHVRRGLDILEIDKEFRIIDENVYNNIIDKLKLKYPNAKIHVFSWGSVKLNYDDIQYHVTQTGDIFLEHFNGLVHSDILVVGSSSFSMSAGFFNKGIVICNDNLYRCTDPIPEIWVENYKKIID